jgi:hypothetical protein
MTRKLPSDAFAFYVSLGPSRSYEAVAQHFGVSKRSVTKLAVKEGWQQLAADAEREGLERAKAKAAESFEEVATRHLKTLRVIQSKALEALRAMPLETAMEAVRALDLAIKQERLVLGEPSERAAISIEDTIKGEYERWLSALPPGDGNDDGAA